MSIEPSGIEAQIEAWRAYLQKRAALAGNDVEELEDHLRGQIGTLRTAGLEDDEAFLVAVKRVGALDDVSREFAREHSDRLWKQLVVPSRAADAWLSREFLVVIGLAIAAAVSVKLPELFGIHLLEENLAYPRNASLFVLPWLTGYFLWKRGASLALAAALVPAFAAAALFANVYPFEAEAHTEVLTILHLPIALWLVVGVAYAGGRWRDHALRMDFVRFTGELAIYYALIAFGGGVLTGITVGMFEAIGLNPEDPVLGWLLPCGAAGAILVASWLVEAKQSVVENMAPVLTRLFTPLFVATLLTFLVAMLWTGERIERDVLIVFDLLLVVVMGLLLYSISARESEAPPDLFDWMSIALLATALVVDVVALASIAGRITDFGFTPNRIAALGENVLLLAHLAGSAVLYLKFVRGSTTFERVERWQTRYLPLYPVWAALVVVLFPPLFGFE
ncbi:MAG: hypothetical protein R3C39_14745 [Dehalococcoidia bacterium]